MTEEQKEAKRAYNRARYSAKRDEIRAKQKLFGLLHPETVKAWARGTYRRHRKSLLAKQALRYAADQAFRERKKANASKASKANPERNKLRSRAQRETPEGRAYVINYGKSYRRMNPEKCLAHTKVHQAVLAGILHKKACEVCGSQDSEAHHHDYSKPLDVRWLCRRHHMAVDGRTKSA